MPNLSHLLAIDARLAAAIRRAERPRRHRPGQPRRHRVEGQIVAQIALPRFLVWHSYISSRKPKRESMLRAAHHLRGIALYRYAQWVQAQGKPLPSDHTPPAWALHPHQRVQQPQATRKDTEKWLNPDDFPDPDDAAAAWWDEFGWDDGIPQDAWEAASPEQRKQWQQEALASVSADLDFQDWIQNTVLNDLQVLQLLESYWNGQATLMSGQEMLGDMGIAGDFNLVDPMAMDFLRYQAGIQVTNIDENTRQQLANALWSGWGGETDEGVGPFGIDQLARYVQGVMQNWENGLSDMSYNRALLIANTEVARAETFGQYIAMMASGVQQKIWVVTAGACLICMTQAEQGPVPIRDQFPNGLMSPPGHPRCFPAGTLVAGPKPVGSVSRFYEGSLVELRTRRGNLLSVTPNHPILTLSGWVKAGDLRECDKVVCGSMRQSAMPLVHPDDYQAPALIEDVAVTFGSASGMAATAVKISAKDLHGDGIEGQIGIIRTNGQLRYGGNASLLQPLLKQLLARGCAKPHSLTGLRNFLSSFTRLLRSTYCRIGSLSIFSSLFGCSASSKNAIGIGQRTQGNARIQQDTMNSSAADPVSPGKTFFRLPSLIGTQKALHAGRGPRPFSNGNTSTFQSIGDGVLASIPSFGQLNNSGTRQIRITDRCVIQVGQGTTSDRDARGFQHIVNCGDIESITARYNLRRFASEVSLDDIVSVQTRFYSGHVYNLETSTGWYIATNSVPSSEDVNNNIGIIVHNCRCSLSPWVDTSKPFNPNDWAYAPDPAQMQRLFQDPSFAAWPAQVANLNDPALQLVPPPPTALGGFGQLQYSDLPPALQQVISPQAFANNYTDAWQMMIQGVGQAVNQAAQADKSVKIAEEAAVFGGGASGKVLTLDDILAGETPADLAESSAQIRSALDDALGQLQDGLANLDDIGDGEGE